jgi:hypothetical protein
MSVTGGDYFQTGLQWNRNYDAMWFDGSNDFVTVPTTGLQTTGGRIECDYFPNRVNATEMIFSHSTTSGGANRLYLQNISGVFSIQIGAETLFSTSQTFDAKKWQHIGIVWDGGSYSYVWDAADYAIDTYTGLSILDANATLGSHYFGDSLFTQGCLRNLQFFDASDTLVDTFAGYGIDDADWGGTVSGSPERCLVHPRGAVIRGLDMTPYVVH